MSETVNDSDREQAKKLLEGYKGLRKLANESIDYAFKSFEDQFSPSGYKKWRELSGRLSKALMDGNVKAVESIKEDLRQLEIEEEKIRNGS